MRFARIDRHVATIVLMDSPVAEPSPGSAPAHKTAEGYLVVDALIARDGLLMYSDGKDSWLEYRPRSELVAAAESWRNAPVTDDHPPKMVDADTWSAVSRGVHIDELKVIGPVTMPGPDGAKMIGTSYLQARLKVCDAALVKKIESGQRELSIGFTSEVVPATDGIAPDGTRCDAVQTSLVGNHTASVPKGRAGPTVRVLMDGAAYHEDTMKRKITIPATAKPRARTDEVGAPTDTVEVVGPDGQTTTVASWIAAILEEYMSMKAAAPAAPADARTQAAPAGVPPLAVSPALPPIPGAPAPVVAAVAPPALPAARASDAPPEPPVDPAKKPEDEEKDDPMKDSATFQPIRRKLDRRAADAGVAEAVIDSDDTAALAKAYLAKVAPHVKTDKMDAASLRAVCESEFDRPAPVSVAHPWERPVAAPRVDADKDASRENEAAYLQSLGYGN